MAMRLCDHSEVAILLKNGKWPATIVAAKHSKVRILIIVRSTSFRRIQLPIYFPTASMKLTTLPATRSFCA